jgi:pyruvate/2-oxoglutarate dehydrogenase complex dihydrolipoamide acyltransferase (E2) component
MPIEVVMPKLSFSMDEGTIAEWYVQDGAQISEGTVLYGVEAEKAVEDIESPGSGVLRIKVQAGQTCPIGTVLAIIE